MSLLNTKMTLAFRIFIILTLLTLTSPQDFVVSLPSTQLSLNQNADYKLGTGPLDMTGYFIPTGAVLLLTLPPQYNTTVLRSKTYTGYSATYGDNCFFDFACTGVAVSFKGNSFAISGLFTSDIQISDTWYFQYTILSVQNPNTLSLGPFAVTIYLGSTIYYPSPGVSSSTTFQSTLSAQAVTYTVQVMNPTIWGVSPLKFTITPNNVIDTIRIRFPSTAWTGETRTNTAATTSGLTFISTSHPTITAANLVSYYAITNLNYYTPLVPIDITVNSITNPSSLMAAGSIVLSLVYSNNVLQTSTFSIPANSFTNDVLRNIAATLTYQASDKLQVDLKFQFPEINANSDRILVTFPSQLVLPSTTSSYTIRMANVIVTPTLTINTGTNTVSFNVSSSSIYQIAVILTVTGISRPRESKTTSTFSIKTLRSNLYLMDSNTCCALQLINRQSLILNSIALSNSRRLQTGVVYTFNFSTSVVNLVTTDVIQIQFPAQYKSVITAGNSATLCAALTIAGVNFPALVKAPACSVTLNQVVISSFLTGGLSGSETFVVALGGVTNPSNSPSTGFTISTLSSSSYVLEQSQGNTITIQPNTLTSFTVSANSLQTCSANTVYSFTLGNNSPVSNGYTISITFPSDYTYINYNTIQCRINGVTYPCTRANSTYHTTTNIVVVQVTATINSITSLTVNSVTNPISFATTGSFSAVIYDQTGTAVESSSGSVTIAMTSTSSFYLFTATAANYSAGTTVIQSAVQTINTVSNSVWLTIATPFTPLVTPSSLLIIFSNANHITYNLLSTCVSTQISSLCTLTTNIGTNNVEVSFPSLTFTTPTSNLIQIEITYLTILNHQQLQITATMSVNGFSSLSLSPSATISKVYAEPVSNYGLALSSQILGQPCTATLTITLSAVTLTQLSSFTVYVPLQFGAGSRVINVPVASFISSQITIASLTNPTVQSYTPFLFTAFNSNGNVIAFSTPTQAAKVYAFTLGCTLPCRTCSSPTVCIDCYTTITWIPQIYYRSSAQTCVSRCVDGEYLNSGVCLACDPTCLTCLMYSSTSYANGNSTYCLTCAVTKFLHFNTCVASCPSGFYASQSTCRSCMANCLNCTDYSTCSSCQSGYSLYSNQCISTCPDSTVSFTNVATSQASCVSCPSNCITCSSAASPLCLNCQYPYYLYNGACHLSCSALSLYISYQMTCTVCQCLTCVNFAYNCASCAAPYNLYQSQCIINCPTGYFPSSNVCVACPTNCLSCTSAAVCLLCQIPFALYIASPASATCTGTCPANTIATIDSSSFIYVCSACGGNCLTCQTSITFCMSCQPTFILNNNTCVSSCPSGLYMISGSCVTCSPTCRVCSASDPYNCTLCAPNYFYYNFTCGVFCPTGTYPDVLALSCKTCNVVCSACMNSTNCTACATGFYLYNSYCYNNCLSINALFYSYNGTCMTCQAQCTTCLTTPVACSSCASSSYYFNPVDSSCSLSCTPPYYINGATCSLCQSPCNTCDTLYDSCLTCIGSLSVFNGKCYASCPSGYYSSSNTCIQCASACLSCTASACQTCQAYAYRFKQTCILDCSTTILPITIDNYCTSCASVPYCEACQTTANNNYVCFSCIFPYVIFQGSCLNQCPNLYAVDSGSNTCVPTTAYSQYMSKLYYDNYPYFPPFGFFGLMGIAAIVLVWLSKRAYKYTYHYGYLIALCASVELLFIIYGLGYMIGLYQGDYTKQNKWMPVFVLLGSYFCKVILGVIFSIFVLGRYYLKDLRFKEWKEQHERGFKVSILLTIIFGSRFYKLYYSKFLGKQIFSYRVISVQKFYYEDIVTWISFIFDITDLSAFVIINYNIFMTYAVLYFLSFQLLLFKAAQWILLVYDLKKPDRGFFLGDEEEAERMMQEQKEAKEKEKRKFEMESLVKLIRRKSAGNLHYDKLYENLFIDDFRSVFDPSDYEDVPKVPNKKIEKNINKGKFRKGKRITMEQKLKRFAESIKPSPVITKQNGYLNNLLYWKPPKQLKLQPKKAPEESQQSMMKLLEDKQLYYEDLSNIHIIDLDDSGVQHDVPSRYRKRKRTGFGVDGQQTVINDTFDHMYDPNSVEFLEPDDHDLNGLWNRNYAKKQHLPQKISHNRYDQNQLRVLYHQPLKKRRSKLNELRSKHF